MYVIKAYVDGKEYQIHNLKVKNLIVGDPYFETGDNINGKAEFKVYPDHPNYSKVKKLTTEIVFLNDGVEEFRGRVLYDDENRTGAKEVFVEGELAYFCDSIQRPKVYHNYSVREYLQDIIDNHNAQVEELKRFTLGRVSVTDPNDSLYRYSNWETTREILKDKLTSRLGGHLVIRRENGIRYLDYLSDEDFFVKSKQQIRFGKNLLDFAKNIDASDIATCIIPLGAKLEQEEQNEELQDQRLTIESVNGGIDYVTDDSAVAEYGKIQKTVVFDDVTVPENLKKKGEEYLHSVQFENMVLNVKAIDMGLLQKDVENLRIGNMVRCISEPNALDSWMPLEKKKVYIAKFSKNTLTLGTEKANATYTSSNRQETASMESTIKSLPTKREILHEAIREATDLINRRTEDGYAIHTQNEFIVADQPGALEAKNLWRWGLGGLAHYSQGYDGPADGIALTMDGKINGKMLLAGSVVAESIDIEYRKSVETSISNSKKESEKYSDNAISAAKQTIETSLKTMEDRINLSVSSTKETVSKRNYVLSGEQESLDISVFDLSGEFADIEKCEFLNMNCFKLSFKNSGLQLIEQSVGELPEGDYEIQALIAFPMENTADQYRPDRVEYGFSDNRSVTALELYEAGKFHSFKKSVHITKESKTVSIAVYGDAGDVCYVTNIRCLRSIQQLFDDVTASIYVEIGKLSLGVTEGDSGSTIELKLGETLISSGEIKITGFVTFEDLSTSGKTTISGSNITTGTIDASKVTVKNLNASYISSGEIDASKVTIKNLNASYISSGEIDASKITVKNIDASNIKSGKISADFIEGGTIDASKVTVNNLNINNVKYGTTQIISCGGASNSPTITFGTSSAYDPASIYIYAKQLTLGSSENNCVYIGKRNNTNSFAFDLKSYHYDAAFRPVTSSSATGGGNCTIGTSSYYFKSAYINNLYIGSGKIQLGANTSASIGFFGQTPASRKSVGKLSTSATLANTITKVNDILTALSGYGLIQSS